MAEFSQECGDEFVNANQELLQQSCSINLSLPTDFWKLNTQSGRPINLQRSILYQLNCMVIHSMQVGNICHINLNCYDTSERLATDAEVRQRLQAGTTPTGAVNSRFVLRPSS
jgi:hypothetical protein